ncbi:hypothetical protein CKAH01_19015 [Colletotrichum kahawae]|uniref:Uncharacterized protein n=1 Tax=Colletotrichum kahawae TaxID=34407 RepID=A0AAD9Y1E9_COLKA|nr:hypothetical protein CKAH01_19015 [Colletotrichum kahawae]
MVARPFKRPRRSSGPPLSTDIDNAVVALGRRTHAIDLANNTIQSQKVPVSKEKRLEELVRDSSRLRQELDYWKGVALTGTTFMANVNEAVTQLQDVLGRFSSVMDESNALGSENSMGQTYSSRSGSNEGAEKRTRDKQDLPLPQDSLDILLAPVRRGRRDCDFEALDPTIAHKRTVSNPGGWL